MSDRYQHISDEQLLNNFYNDHDNQWLGILFERYTLLLYGVSMKYLKDQGYRIIPVNPTAEEILGEKVYPDLESVPEKIDVVQVFRKPEDVPPVVDSAINAGAKVIWMQEGIINEEAAQKAREEGLKVVMDACMRVSHRRLIGDKLLKL